MHQYMEFISKLFKQTVCLRFKKNWLGTFKCTDNKHAPISVYEFKTDWCLRTLVQYLLIAIGCKILGPMFKTSTCEWIYQR